MFSAEGEAEAENETRVSDDVQTPVPASALRQMFAYRHRQLAADLATQRWAALHRSEPLTVAVTGASGVVGTALTALLTTGGHQVIRPVRHPAKTDGERQWQPDQPDPHVLACVDAVRHLAGASIAGRLTPAYKLGCPGQPGRPYPAAGRAGRRHHRRPADVHQRLRDRVRRRRPGR